LFVQTARRIEPGFSLDNQQQAVVDICRAVEGMPLGLELAATWLRVMPCEHIAGKIGDDLDFLATPLRNVEERHRSLRAVFEHSWSLLSEAECDVVMKMSVFRGGCDLDAAEQVAGASLWLLAGLVDKSLVRLNPVGRYEMHELLRQFAADKLLESGQMDVIRHCHLQYFLSVVEELEQKFFGPDHLAALDQCEIEHDNCRAALDWAWQAGDMESGLRLANALGWFWRLRAYCIEGKGWLDKFSKTSLDIPVLVQAKALLFRLELGSESDDAAQIDALSSEALEWAARVEDRRLRASLYLRAAFHGYYPITYYEDALALFLETGDQVGVNQALCFLSQRALQLGEFARADELQAEGIKVARQIGDKGGLAELLMLSACNRWYQRKIDQETLNLYHESLALHRQLRNKGGTMLILHSLGSIAYIHGENKQARELLVSSLRLAQEIGSMAFILRGLISLSKVLCSHYEREQGARILGAIGDMVLSSYTEPGFFAQEALEDYEFGLATARAHLGEAAFNAAFAEGKRMTLEEATAYALSDAAFVP
jgi:hypothetical protein